jgi:hypothetical protein
VWPQVIRPALSDRIGKAIFISTPNGLNYFYDLWLRGQQEEEKSWNSWQFPTSANPYIDPEEIEEARLNLVPEVFEQEYLALFRGDGISVFRDIDRRCHITVPDPWKETGMYIAGLDWAGKQDYTVLSIFEVKSHRQVHILRMKQIDFPTQHTKIISACQRYHVTNIIAEENTIGAQNIDILQGSGIRVTPFLTTQDSKQQAIQNLIYLFEMEQVHLLDDKAQIGELKNFIVSRTPNGKFRYAAQRGHDDIVIADMLACSVFTIQKEYPPHTIVQVAARKALARKEPKTWSKNAFYLD